MHAWNDGPRDETAVRRAIRTPREGLTGETGEPTTVGRP